jgi:hypothetical protein
MLKLKNLERVVMVIGTALLAGLVAYRLRRL